MRILPGLLRKLKVRSGVMINADHALLQPQLYIKSVI